MAFKRVANTLEKDSRRAERYKIRTAIRYRVRGESRWHEGTTENISIIGVLIRTSHFLEPQTAIEMRFVLPVELSGENAAEVFCRGVVVRSAKCPAVSGEIVMASTIIHARFLRNAEVRHIG
ncbi:MAG TPA: PilZ domain-containing protein [Pseudacidobacterium sp.]|nr:PilZ domain-containing protein [Pseudacidobacterium sp.]